MDVFLSNPSTRPIVAFAGSFTNQATGTCLVFNERRGELYFEQYGSIQRYKVTFPTKSSTLGTGTPIRGPLLALVEPQTPQHAEHHQKASKTLVAHIGARHMSFFHHNGVVSKVVWQSEEDSVDIRYQPVQTPCHILAIPQEIRDIIIDFAMTSNNGDIYLFEARGQKPGGQMRFAASAYMPRGRREDAFEGNIRELPKSFNGLQYTCREFASTRGMELQKNRLLVNGWNFDSFLVHAPKKDLLDHIRAVTLCGDFKMHYWPDETLLHRLASFAHAHPKAQIEVECEQLKIKDKNERILSFLSLVYCICEAVHGIPRPEGLAKVLDWRQKDTVAVWCGNKPRGALNARNLNFVPHQHDTWNHDVDFPAVAYKMNKTKKTKIEERDVKSFLLKQFGDAEGFAALVEEWYEIGVTPDTAKKQQWQEKKARQKKAIEEKERLDDEMKEKMKGKSKKKGPSKKKSAGKQ